MAKPPNQRPNDDRDVPRRAALTTNRNLRQAARNAKRTTPSDGRPRD